MEKTPFSVYDFLAYLSAGSVLIASVDYVYGSPIMKTKDISAPTAIALLLAAYILGHVISHISNWLLESILIRRILDLPTTHLMSEVKILGFKCLVFPGYYRPLPASVQNRVKDGIASRNCTATDDGLFLHCYSIATANLEKLQSRLDDFRTQYGFARNMSCSLLIAAATIFSYRISRHDLHIRWAFIALTCGITMLYRYLKFFRQYSYELLIRYAELPTK